MTILPKLVYIFNVVSIKISAGLSKEIDNLILIFIWKFKGVRVAKIILEKKKKAKMEDPYCFTSILAWKEHESNNNQNIVVFDGVRIYI